MSTFFSANQYENAYDPKRMGNWEIPHPYVERPPKNAGFTQVLANDRGHILPYVRRSSANPWGNFVGTWQMPKKLPGPKYDLKTSRGEKMTVRLAVEAEDAKHFTSGRDKNDRRLLISDRRKPNFAELPPIKPEIRSPPRPLSGTGSVDKDDLHVTMQLSPTADRLHSPPVYPKTHYPQPEELRELTPLSDTRQEFQRSPILSPKGGVGSPIRGDVSARGSVNSSQGNANMEGAFAH